MENSREIKENLLNMLDWFHHFCVENNLRYYIVGGTMLGAIRHNGFIPWDDDVDVALPRADYLKLEKLLAGKDGRYILETPNCCGADYIYPFSKLYDTMTTLTENRKPVVRRGLYIDIFPLDGLGDTEEEALNRFSKFHKLFVVTLAKTTGIRKGRSLYKNLAVAIMRLIPISGKYLVSQLIKLAEEYDFDSSKYVANLFGAYGKNEIMDKGIFGEPTEYDFEDIKVLGPEKSEEFLRQIYGNWRELPPIEKQVSHHDFLECDLHKSYINN